jgi:DNA anti-recombination protein RmuC
MTDSPQSQNPENAPGDLHWGIAYLREDIQDLRQEIRSTNKRLDDGLSGIRQEMAKLAGDSRQDLSERTNNLRDELGGRIDSLRDELGARIDNLREEMGTRIDSLREEFRLEIQKVRAEASANHELLLKHMDTRFYWTITTMVAMTAVIIGSIKM